MEDYHLVEKLAQVGSVEAVFSASLYIHFDNFLETHPTLLVQFNRGKIPERVVHARGMSAKGYFEV